MIPEEGQTVEWKESLGERREIAETCAAFATAQGGRIYIGVNDKGMVLGVQLGKGTLEQLANDIAQNTVPRLVPFITTIQESGKTVIVVEVRENATKPVAAYGRAYRRSGRTNQVLAPSEAADLYLTTRGITWDEMPLAEVSLADIAPEKVRQFLDQARTERRWDVNPDLPVEQVLRQLNLLRNEQPTVAAVLLFGRHPQRHLVQSAVRCARFKGDQAVHFLDMKVIDGSVIEQVEEAMAFVKRHISMAAEIKDLEREERWEYPLDAVREAITNAVCHRDYAESGNVQVRIFDHGLEVWNPGALPPGLTVDDLRRNHESKPRNKLIARAFFLIRYIEQFGTGTGRMIEECREAGLPEPEFECRTGSFRIMFRKSVPVEERFAGLGLNERQLRALQELVTKGRITRQEYVSVTGSSERTAKRDLMELVERKILVKHGKTKGSWYELASK